MNTFMLIFLLSSSVNALENSKPGFVIQHPISRMNCTQVLNNIRRWKQQGFEGAAEGLRRDAIEAFQQRGEPCPALQQGGEL